MTDTANLKKFSVIIPAFNAERTIDRTLQSLIAQNSAGDFEIIVVDDGSADKTAEIVRKYPVKLIQKENCGPAAARNLGVEESSCDIVLFTDCDCVPEPDWVQKMTEPFTDKDVSGVKGVYISRNRNIIARIIQLEFEERYLMLKKLKYIDFVDSYSAAVRKEAFLSVGGFDTSFPKADNEDVDLSYKMANAGYKMVFQPEAVVEHLGHPANLMRYLKVKFSRGFWRTAVYKRHPGKAVKDSYTPQSLKLQILMSALTWFSLILGVFSGYWVPLAVSIIAFLFFTLIFLVKVFKIDPIAAILSPFIHFIRATCFLWGIFFGFFRHFMMNNDR